MGLRFTPIMLYYGAWEKVVCGNWCYIADPEWL